MIWDLNEIGSGSTIINDQGKPLAFYSTVKDGSMKFWRAVGSSDLTDWHHEGPNPFCPWITRVTKV